MNKVLKMSKSREALFFVESKKRYKNMSLNYNFLLPYILNTVTPGKVFVESGYVNTCYNNTQFSIKTDYLD